MTSEALTTSPAEQNPLHQALQKQLLQILETPISVASLAELQNTAMLARKLLELSDPKAKMLQKMSGYGGGSVTLNGYSLGDTLEPMPITEAMAPAPQVETFGATVLRELIPVLKNQIQGNTAKREPRLAELLDARALAEKNGNDKLVKKIDERIERAIEESYDFEYVDGPEGVDPKNIDDCMHPGCQAPAAVGGKKGMLCLEHYDAEAIQVPQRFDGVDPEAGKNLHHCKDCETIISKDFEQCAFHAAQQPEGATS